MCLACLVVSFGQELSDLTQIAGYYAVASLLIPENSLLKMVRTVNQMEEEEEAEKKKNVLGAVSRAHSQRMRGRERQCARLVSAEVADRSQARHVWPLGWVWLRSSHSV